MHITNYYHTSTCAIYDITVKQCKHYGYTTVVYLYTKDKVQGTEARYVEEVVNTKVPA